MDGRRVLRRVVQVDARQGGRSVRRSVRVREADLWKEVTVAAEARDAKVEEEEEAAAGGWREAAGGGEGEKMNWDWRRRSLLNRLQRPSGNRQLWSLHRRARERGSEAERQRGGLTSLGFRVTRELIRFAKSREYSF